jgi:hypothetical protein
MAARRWKGERFSSPSHKEPLQHERGLLNAITVGGHTPNRLGPCRATSELTTDRNESDFEFWPFHMDGEFNLSLAIYLQLGPSRAQSVPPMAVIMLPQYFQKLPLRSDVSELQRCPAKILADVDVRPFGN